MQPFLASEYQNMQHTFILLHDNVPSHRAKTVKKAIEAFVWRILSHAAYSGDLAPPDYYLFHRWNTNFLSRDSLLTKMHENWSMIGFPQKSKSIFSGDGGMASTNCQRDGENV